MVDSIISLGHWNWFIAAAVFLLIEVLAPGIFMLWLGLAALLVGIISIGVVWPWQAQFIAFAVFALVSVPAWRHFTSNRETADSPFLNRRADTYVGRVFTLERPIVDGVGAVRIDDTVWRMRGPDCPAGSRVRIARADGPCLLVEAA
jgi:membrane protein implicated in regulation of membrane protease activity